MSKGSEGRNKHPLKLIIGNSVPALGAQVAHLLGTKPANALISRFADGETRVQIQESVRDCDCYVLQSTCNPVNEHLMELLIVTDALRRGSAHKIHVVIPYFGYARQDKKTRPREPITARLAANLIEEAGADAVTAVDLHSNSIVGFFYIPVDHLTALILLGEDISAARPMGVESVVVSPDAGGVERVKFVADRIGLPIAIIHKKRDEPNQTEVMELVGDVRGKCAFVVDDLIDTGRTICKGAALLKQRGAKEVRVYAPHGVFSENALADLRASAVHEVVVTDTIPPKSGSYLGPVRVVGVAKLLADAIRLDHAGESVHGLFK